MEKILVNTPISNEIAERYRGDEISLLNSFLSELEKYKLSLNYRVISEIESDVGIEIYSESEKIAEVYCAENRDGFLTGELQIHGIENWTRSKILTAKEASLYVRKKYI